MLQSEEIKRLAGGRLPEILPNIVPEVAEALATTKHINCPVPGHEHNKPSFRWDPKKERFICSDGSYDVFAIVMEMRGCEFRDALQAVADAIGYQSNGNGKPLKQTPEQAFESIAIAKSCTVDGLKRYGGLSAGKTAIKFPGYFANGDVSGTFTQKVNDKGKWNRGAQWGVFLPHEEGGKGKPIIPQAGETWLLVEGVKDASVLSDMGFKALGMPSCELTATLTPVLQGVHVIFVPDRDEAADNGVVKTASLLHGLAASIRKAILPVPFTKSSGADVRDCIRQHGEQAIKDCIDRASVITTASHGTANDSTEAIRMLENPRLFDIVGQDIATAGVVGERHLAATIFLCGVSRLLENPVGARVIGQSSSGKSYVIKTVAGLFPEEAKYEITSMSPLALAYLEEDELSHRMLVCGERSRRRDDAAAEATRMLRELISNGRVVHRTLIRQQPTELVINGPVAFIESTTLAASQIFDEDRNRVMTLHTDDTQQQTERVLKAVGKQSRTGDYTITMPVVEKHHAAQRLLETFSVRIPFAEYIADHFPSRQVESRRAIRQLFAVVEASALLHQRQRKSTESFIEAAAEDYLIAKTLVGDALGRTLGGAVSEAARRAYVDCVNELSEEWTHKDVKTLTEKSKPVASDYISEWVDNDVAECVQESRGNKPARYRLTGKKPSSAEALPDLPPEWNK